MKNISYWAKFHPKQAIIIIILIEVFKGISGFLLGYEVIPTLPEFSIEVWVLLIVFLITFIEIYYQHKKQSLDKSKIYQLRIFATGIILFSGMTLAILAGNNFRNAGYSTENQLNAKAVTIKKSVENSENLERNLINKSIQKQLLQNSIISRKNHSEEDISAGRRIGYVALFILSLILTYLSVFLTCSLICNEHYVLALISLLLSIGVLSGGIYFLIKAFRKVIKPYKAMEKQERQKEWRIFGIISSIIGFLVMGWILLSSR